MNKQIDFKYCDCWDWLVNIDKLNAPYDFIVAYGGHGYDGLPFKYCPWCGKELKIKSDFKNGSNT